MMAHGAPRRQRPFTPSTALPHRLALLGERGGPLAGVLGDEDLARELGLLLPGLLLGPVLRGADDALGGIDRERAVAGDRGRELERGVDRAARLGQPVDEAHGMRALGADGIAG